MSVDRQRRERMVEALGRSQLQALACSSPADVLLLTGYWPVMGSSIALMTRDGDLAAIVPEDELELAHATSNADFIPYKPHSLDRLTTAAEALASPMKQLSARLRIDGGEIGAELRDNIQPVGYQASNRFRECILSLLPHYFPGALVVSADDMLGQLKAVKTSAELEQIRRAAKLAAAGFDEAEEAVRAGRQEDEVAADIEAAFARVANHGFERGRGYFFCMSGLNSAKAAGAYARTRRRVLEKGDFVMIHANTVGDGYWTDITRNYVVGPQSRKQRRMREAIAEARAAALEAIVPGARASAVDAAARDALKKRGFGAEFKHATGHGVGFAAVNPDGLPRIHPRSPDILEAGMTFNIEPAIYFDGVGGMRHCDVVACTEDGVEVLTDF